MQQRLTSIRLSVIECVNGLFFFFLFIVFLKIAPFSPIENKVSSMAAKSWTILFKCLGINFSWIIRLWTISIKSCVTKPDQVPNLPGFPVRITVTLAPTRNSEQPVLLFLRWEHSAQPGMGAMQQTWSVLNQLVLQYLYSSSWLFPEWITLNITPLLKTKIIYASLLLIFRNH